MTENRGEKADVGDAVLGVPLCDGRPGTVAPTFCDFMFGGTWAGKIIFPVGIILMAAYWLLAGYGAYCLFNRFF